MKISSKIASIIDEMMGDWSRFASRSNYSYGNNLIDTDDFIGMINFDVFMGNCGAVIPLGLAYNVYLRTAGSEHSTRIIARVAGKYGLSSTRRNTVRGVFPIIDSMRYNSFAPFILKKKEGEEEVEYKYYSGEGMVTDSNNDLIAAILVKLKEGHTMEPERVIFYLSSYAIGKNDPLATSIYRGIAPIMEFTFYSYGGINTSIPMSFEVSDSCKSWYSPATENAVATYETRIDGTPISTPTETVKNMVSSRREEIWEIIKKLKG